MRLLIVIVLLALGGAGHTLAQTETPTPTPTQIEMIPIPRFPPIASPTPIGTMSVIAFPTSINLPTGDIYTYLSTADANLAALPSNLENPYGQPLLPAERGGSIFGYAKWILSFSTAEELLDPLAPPVQHASAIMTMTLVTVGIAFVLFMFVFIVRFIVWLVRLAMEFIPL